MRILNENDDNELLPEEIDLDLGYLINDQIFKEHHEAIPPVKEVSHFEVKTFFFADDTSYSPLTQDDPHISIINKDIGEFSYNNLEGEEEKELRAIELNKVIDVYPVPGKREWDEYENIQRYHLYTEEELEEIAAQKEAARKQAELLNSGLDRLENLEGASVTQSNDIQDLILTMADFLGIEE